MDVYEYRILAQLEAMSSLPLLNLSLAVTFTTEEFIASAKVYAYIRELSMISVMLLCSISLVLKKLARLCSC